MVAVDGDLRKPTLHEIFGVNLSPGVSDFAYVWPAGPPGRTDNRYLEVIPAGIPQRHPADIAAADVPRLLRALHESERTVVLDCPPLVGVGDEDLVTKADAVVFVVDARKFDLERLEHSLAQMRSIGANVVGIVLNRVRRRGGRSPMATTGRYRRPHAKAKRRRLQRSR